MMNQSTTSQKRNYGIDLLRLISMFYIVTLHTVGQGGILATSQFGSPSHITSQFLQVCSYGAVNIFGLISGYVSYSEKEKPTRFSSYINLWIQVVFYGCLIGSLMNIYNTDFVNTPDFIRMFFPVTNNLYWYFTAYTGLFFVIPIINAGIRGCSKKYLKALFIFMFVLFSMLECFTNGQKFNNGYSLIWLLILYIMGAIIKKCEIGKKANTLLALLAIFILNIIVTAWKIYGFEFEIFFYKLGPNTLLSYLSPFILLVAILHVSIFSKLQFGKPFEKAIAFAAPCAFSVYLLNTQYYVWYYLLKNAFISWALWDWWKMGLAVIGFSLLFVIGSICIDKIRLLLFKIFCIEKLVLKLDTIFQKLTTEISNTNE